jgi:hypothetical protein
MAVDFRKLTNFAQVPNAEVAMQSAIVNYIAHRAARNFALANYKDITAAFASTPQGFVLDALRAVCDDGRVVAECVGCRTTKYVYRLAVKYPAREKAGA